MSQTRTESLISRYNAHSKRLYELLVFGYVRNTQCMIIAIIPNDIIFTIFSVYQNIPKRYALHNEQTYCQSMPQQQFRIDVITSQPYPPNYIYHIITTENEDKLQKQLTSALNKITPQNYNKMTKTIMDIVYVFADTAKQMNTIIELISTTATKQPQFVTEYVALCSHIQEHLLKVGVICEYEWIKDNPDVLQAFRKMVILQANALFNQYRNHSPEADIMQNIDGEMQEFQKTKGKEDFFSMMIFIAECCNAELIGERVIFRGVFESLLPPFNTNFCAIDIEGMCRLLERCGKTLESKGKQYMDKYLEILKKHARTFDFITVLLVDEISEMRENKWILRKNIVRCTRSAAIQLTVQEQLFSQLQNINTSMQSIKFQIDNVLTPNLIQLNQQTALFQANPALLQLPQNQLQFYQIQQQQIMIVQQINSHQLNYQQMEQNLKYVQEMYQKTKDPQYQVMDEETFNAQQQQQRIDQQTVQSGGISIAAVDNDQQEQDDDQQQQSQQPQKHEEEEEEQKKQKAGRTGKRTTTRRGRGRERGWRRSRGRKWGYSGYQYQYNYNNNNNNNNYNGNLDDEYKNDRNDNDYNNNNYRQSWGQRGSGRGIGRGRGRGRRRGR